MTTTPSPEFLARLRRREPELLRTIFAEHNAWLLRVLASQGFYDEVAEDLLHQTWERFLTNLDLFAGRSQLRTFLCGILLNKVREQRRLAKRVVFEEDAESVMSRAFTPEGWWNSPPPEPSAVLYSAQISKLVAVCLEGLTDDQRTAFLLKEVEQEDAAEICNVLGVSVSNLRVLIFRAKEKLRRCLAGHVGEG